MSDETWGIDDASEPFKARIAELEDRLRDYGAVLQHRDRVEDALRARLAAAEAERDRLRAALEKYGEHGAMCKYLLPSPGIYGAHICTCGFRAALRGEGDASE